MRRPITHGLVLLSALAGVLAVPGASPASSGGAGLGVRVSASPPPAPTSAPPASGVATASGPGITLSTQAAALLGGRLTISGRVSARYAGDLVEIDRLGRQTGGRWATTAQARVDGHGHFAAVWNVNHIGRFSVRAVVSGARSPRPGARAAMASPLLTITVYRPAVATIYGPGLYGNTTACGQRLTPHTLGVAHRTLPCGTPVALLYHGRTLVVPVIDRGPYTSGVDWDLSQATANALGVDGTATIGAVSLPRG